MNSPHTLIIEPGLAEKHYWRDLWRYRELFYVLAWRDITVRYKQTVIGITWALIQPLLTMAVLTVIFGRVAKLPTEGAAPYPLMVYAGMLPWQFFSSSLSASSSSLVGNAHLISKVYFPRLIIPISAIVVSLVDFLISAAFLAVLMAVYGVVPDARVFLLPLFLFVAFGAALGVGLWLTALNVKYRDFRFILPFIIQFGLYVSPVAFTSNLVPARWRALYELNPMVGIIDGFRWALLRGNTPPWSSLAYSLALVAVLLVTGVWYFRKTEKTFADVI